MDYETLSERKKQILYNSIDDYIQSNSPITSGAIHEKHLSEISSATLRNELSALEAMGYLHQLHTSSGRIPTSKAYRLYVNELMKESKFDKKSLNIVKGLLNKRTTYLNDMVNSIADVISKLTNYPSVVVVNSFNNLVVDTIKIIPLIDGNGIVLIGTKAGIINSTITLNFGVTEENCIDASNFLTLKFTGHTISEMNENINLYKKDMQENIKGFEKLCNNLLNCLSDLLKNKNNVKSTGATKLLNNPEYSKTENAKKILNLLEDQEKLTEIFTSSNNDDFSVSIGKENTTDVLENCSVVKAQYKIGGKNVASIGVIGPERMDYGKTLSALKIIVNELNKLNYLTKNEKKEED